MAAGRWGRIKDLPKLKDLFNLFFTFIIIGASSFGGGYSLLPVLERELIKKRGWLTMDEVMDYFSLAQITPGVIAINVSTFVGYKRKGVAGGLAATIGFILPGVSLMIAASFFITRFAEYTLVRNAFSGIRIAVGALILTTLIKLVKGFFKNIKTTLLFIIAFVLSAVFSASPVFIVLGAGLAGFFLFPVWRNRGDASTAGTDAAQQAPDKEPEGREDEP
jgi:chromate transporter